MNFYEIPLKWVCKQTQKRIIISNMKKILTRIETSIGYETYRLVIESANVMKSHNGFYFIQDAMIISIITTQANASLTDGPFKKGFYDVLKFPIDKTLLSQQSLDYGAITNKES